MADIATLLLETATSACRTSECPQTFGVKRLTYESLLSASIRMDTFWWSINLWTGKNFLAVNFLKQVSRTQRVETGESENFSFGMPMEDLHLL